MADVDIIPKIRCDNCGFIAEKTNTSTDRSPSFSKPRKWGMMKAEGSVSTDSYGGKSRLDFADLCPKCAQIALDAAAQALSEARKEGSSNG